jgi:hypothetical protein
VFGLARNARLEARIADALSEARTMSQANEGQPARVFRDFEWSTKESWSRRRRVIGKAEWTGGEANPRFLVTSLKADAWRAKPLYEKLYCARGEMENRIKECQLDLDSHPARQSAAAVARRDGLCAPVRAAPHRPGPHCVRERDLRHDPPETAEARRARQNQRPARQDRLRFGLPERPGMAPRRGKARKRARLANLTRVAAARQCSANPRPTGETIPPIDENHRAPAPPTVTPAQTRPSNRAETDVQLPARVRNAG